MRAGREGTLKAQALRAMPTEAERKLWSRLRGGQLGWDFRRQHPIPPYIVDFACIAARLVVEADGGQHSESAADEKRDRFLQGEGWIVQRYWNNEILENIDGVMQKIADFLNTGPHPTLPRKRGRATVGDAEAR
ncbi:MAG TPA: endonuclease domain-containing protein [Stellaceae bacterium]|jgi:primosomal protein N' (replication factor Y)|nr:endonuclease domain-containing protein [Stellaceae bacterium]